MTSAASVKERLKNKAVATGKTMQELLTVYGLERTVYRLSISDYAERLKAVFFYMLSLRGNLPELQGILTCWQRGFLMMQKECELFSQIFSPQNVMTHCVLICQHWRSGTLQNLRSITV